MEFDFEKKGRFPNVFSDIELIAMQDIIKKYGLIRKKNFPVMLDYDENWNLIKTPYLDKIKKHLNFDRIEFQSIFAHTVTPKILPQDNVHSDISFVLRDRDSKFEEEILINQDKYFTFYIVIGNTSTNNVDYRPCTYVFNQSKTWDKGKTDLYTANDLPTNDNFDHDAHDRYRLKHIDPGLLSKLSIARVLPQFPGDVLCWGANNYHCGCDWTHNGIIEKHYMIAMGKII